MTESRQGRNIGDTSSDPVVVGVDAGGSSTRAAVVSADGTVRGYGTAAAGNPTSSGVELARDNVISAVRGALDAAGRSPRDPVRVAVAMAGASGAGPAWLADALRDADIGGDAALEADLAAIYLSGSRARLGYALLAGTGAIAARLVDHRIAAVSDGLGWLVGDDGSGFWIGCRAVRAAAAHLDGRGPETALTTAVLDELAGTDATDPRRGDALARILRAVYTDRPVRLARFAPLVFAAADAGDSVAEELVADAAALLASTLGAVLADESLADEPDAPVVLGGGVLSGQRRMSDTVRAELTRRGFAGEVSIVPDGVVGAAVLALEGAGIPVSDAVAERIRSSVAGFR